MTDQLANQVNYAYDTAGRLETLTDADGTEVIHYAYDSSGRLSREAKGNGTYTTYAYNASAQLDLLLNHAPDGAIQSQFDYTYDLTGRRVGMDTLDGSWTYQYDAIGQLTRAVFDSVIPDVPDQDLAYEYDAAGNRTAVTDNGATTVYATNNMNQYTDVGTTTYKYDDDGNLISKTDAEGTSTYQYDVENRLVGVVTTEGTWVYEYDALGNRVATVENGVRTTYLLDPMGLVNVVGQYDASGDLIAHYTHGWGLASRTDGTGDGAYYAFDALGSTSELTDGTGVVLNDYRYGPSGNTLGQSESLADPFQFVGRYGVMSEANGLDFMRARFYDADLGRFIAEDPIGLGGGDLLSYRYASNDPTEFIDPLGLDWRNGVLNVAVGATAGVAGIVTVVGATTAAPLAVGGLAIVGGGIIIGQGLHEMFPNWCPRIRQDSLPWERWADAFDDWYKDRHPGWQKKHDISPSPGFPETGSPGSGSGAAGGPGSARVPGRPDGSTPPDGPSNGGAPGGQGSNGAAQEFDPNEKTGPSGFGEQRYVNAESVIGYRVDFENDTTATAPAQFVRISDQLSDDFDWSTFELTEIGFGDTLIAVPEGSQHYETTIEMTAYNGQPIELLIEAGLRPATGEVYAMFMSLDPGTELPPEVMTGFLPPEDGTGRGMGQVSYAIHADENLPSGTEIRNVATIQFGFAETIDTNQVDPHDPGQGTDPDKEALVTIDAGTPSSAVDPLPAAVSAHEFTVTWSGQDDAGGSGIGSYDVYVSTDGGPFELWLDDTTETSALFDGLGGRTYAFYSVATDNVGHREAAPSVPDADTTTADVLYWDASGAGHWGDISAITGNSRWVDSGGNAGVAYPEASVGAVVKTDTVTVAADRSAAALAVESGAIAISADATLTLAGDLLVDTSGAYVADLGGTASGLIAARGDANLAGALTLRASSSLAAVGNATRTTIAVEGQLNGTFQTEPSPGDHLGFGVFHRAVSYGPGVVNVDVFQAAAGDTNGDGETNNADLQRILGAGSFGNGTGWDWTQGDFDGDTDVDSADLQLILATGVFGSGPYAAVATDSSFPVPDTNGSFTAADARSAADAVHAQSPEKESATLETSWDELDWLYQIEKTTTGGPSADKGKSEEAVDDLLAAYWS